MRNDGRTPTTTATASDIGGAGRARECDEDEQTLAAVERRILWLATSMVHFANHHRENNSGIKIGGHQASSASMTSIMTALYFRHLRATDLVSVKPHASPVLHAINYLLGRLDGSYLTELRSFGGLQSYPSRTKDPDPVDFSTGSVGIGATATLWSGLARRFIESRTPGTGLEPARHIALVGDGELDEGAVWEAVNDPMISSLGEVLWIVDVNRQSLDRVIPGIAMRRIESMFEAVGWQTITVKYGRGLRAAFQRDGGDGLRERIDEMSNEEYQRLLRADVGDHRAVLSADASTRESITAALQDLDDVEVAELVRDLGGHDLADLSDAIGKAENAGDRPTVVFAYTLKARGLPTVGHPGNHSALLNEEQWRKLAVQLEADPNDPWRRFHAGSPEDVLCAETAHRLQRREVAPATPGPIPTQIGRAHAPRASTQQALGRLLVDLSRSAPEIAARVVTVSPDVASTTNLGGWINEVGVWNPSEKTDWFAEANDVLMRWKESPTGQHIELGIAEGNLVGLLSELGTTWSRYGEPLFPIGAIYDPFVSRALEPWSFGMYSGGQSILVGTPSGITLAPEGGAHQSITTPSIGLEQPGCIAWEPCFTLDFEWTFLHALSRLGRPNGTSSYFRLSTRPIDQTLAAVPDDPAEREMRREQAVAGGYRLRTSPGQPDITLVGMGVVMPEVVSAADELDACGISTDVVCVTSADLLYRAARARRGLNDASPEILDSLFPQRRVSPIVSVIDGHPHTLAFLAGLYGQPATQLGVEEFGQVGTIDDLYRHYGIDTATIVGAAWDLIDEVQLRDTSQPVPTAGT